MSDTLTVISLLGVAQGAVITWMLVFHLAGNYPGKWPVRIVFLACTLAMLLITLVNAGWIREIPAIKLSELFIRFWGP